MEAIKIVMKVFFVIGRSTCGVPTTCLRSLRSQAVNTDLFLDVVLTFILTRVSLLYIMCALTFVPEPYVECNNYFPESELLKLKSTSAAGNMRRRTLCN